ncbi:hypothetical protein MRB53_036886 [Persea americana]|nr:hypothetical protein MRB53_036886 [Persea americana]
MHCAFSGLAAQSTLSVMTLNCPSVGRRNCRLRGTRDLRSCTSQPLPSRNPPSFFIEYFHHLDLELISTACQEPPEHACSSRNKVLRTPRSPASCFHRYMAACNGDYAETCFCGHAKAGSVVYMVQVRKNFCSCPRPQRSCHGDRVDPLEAVGCHLPSCIGAVARCSCITWLHLLSAFPFRLGPHSQPSMTRMSYSWLLPGLAFSTLPGKMHFSTRSSNRSRSCRTLGANLDITFAKDFGKRLKARSCRQRLG